MQEDDDIFLTQVRGTKPLKKSGRYVKEIKVKRTNKDSIKKNKSTKIKETQVKIKETQVFKEEKFNVKSFSNNNFIIKKRLKRGKIYIDKKVDLHGCSLDQARKKFFETIDSCYFANKRCILFVTGKGMKNPDENNKRLKLYYGKIRENFKSWVY